MSITPTRQRNAISEGMALGLVVCGRTSLPFDKLRVDLSFERAWRNWPYASRFPQVSTDLRKGLDAVWAMTRASERKHVMVLHWDTSGGELEILTRQSDWDPDDDEDVAFAVGMIDGDVPLEGWVNLARDFLSHFDD